MKSKLAVGDRIKVVGYARNMSDGKAYAFDGKKLTVVAEFFMTVIFDYRGDRYEVYKTACRRLKPKKKPEVIEAEAVVGGPEPKEISDFAIRNEGKRFKIRIEVLDEK